MCVNNFDNPWMVIATIELVGIVVIFAVGFMYRGGPDEGDI